MTTVTIATFDNQNDVDKTIEDLTDAGLPRIAIRVSSESGSDYGTGTDTGESKGFWESLGDLFMPDDDRTAYESARESGRIVMTVTADDSYSATVEDILQEFGTLDEDTGATGDLGGPSTWSGSATGMATDTTGMTGAAYPTGGATGGMAEGAARYTGQTADTSPGRSGSDNDVLPVVEEDIEIGKRQVSGGRMRVRSYVVETPYSEDVTLREEHVEVVRNPVDRALQPGEEVFADRVVEAEAMSERAVVNKTARVVEEVSLQKTATERAETVSDTLRSTRVEVESDEDETDPDQRSSTGSGNTGRF